MAATTTTPVSARRPRSFVRVAGPDAEALLQRLVSNDVAALGVGESCEALLLTPKARVIAPLRIVRRDEQDFLLLSEPELGERVRSHLRRLRLASRAEVEAEEHESHVLLGECVETSVSALRIPVSDYGVPAVEVIGAAPPPAETQELTEDELELLRIEAGTPRYGREIDERVLPAEAGLVERSVSFTKGCYPGQEPIARLHHRGHANRRLRVLELDAEEPPAYDAEVRSGERVVGRVTSVARREDGRLVGLAYVRVDVPADAELTVGGAPARQLR
ncbi:MAG: folate-binding protein YgfZ [Actinobacteria bacterium]|nr:folate-binding protein YgfZ [Actinomycetota bacterium]